MEKKSKLVTIGMVGILTSTAVANGGRLNRGVSIRADTRTTRDAVTTAHEALVDAASEPSGKKIWRPGEEELPFTD